MGSKNFGEAGKRYFILTRDLGLVLATAQGVRKMSSKLRFILQDFSYVKIDLVRGRDVWRVTSASKTNALEFVGKRKTTLQVFGNIARLLRRLLAGEDPNQDMFIDVVAGLAILEKAKSREEIFNIEALIVLRVLHNLGYVGEVSLSPLVKSPMEQEILYEAAKNRAAILREINKALKETHL